VASARNCRFAFDVLVDVSATSYKVEAVYDDETTERLSTYEIAEIRSMQRWFHKMSEGLGQIPVPDCDLVYATQDVRDSKAYQDSIIPGIYTLKRYLTDCGIDLGTVSSLLDFGCGTGRLLVGWYLDNPGRDLHGCDINGELIRWAKANLPGKIIWNHTALSPPLPYASKSLDLVLAVSVFTHLSSSSQQSWVEEFKRVLNPGGYVLITLHGEAYVRLTRAKKLKKFLEAGYIEDVSRDEGSNSCAAFHGYEFVESLFDEFQIVGYFPRGNTHNGAALSRVAAFQDVYVLKYRC
jgi:SAM-dependent methyltransferase